MVPQESVLFSGSILENLMSMAEDAKFERAMLACKMAGIHSDIENLPEGYQTANELKGKVTILFITHKVPKSLKVDAHLKLSR